MWSTLLISTVLSSDNSLKANGLKICKILKFINFILNILYNYFTCEWLQRGGVSKRAGHMLTCTAACSPSPIVKQDIEGGTS